MGQHKFNGRFLAIAKKESVIAAGGLIFAYPVAAGPQAQ